MSVQVLKESKENAEARKELHRRGLDFATPWLSNWLYKTRILTGLRIGDKRKSWDVLKTVDFINDRIEKSAPILDIGAYSSEVLFGLHKMGFSDLTGIDLNPNIRKMPMNGPIHFVVGDFTSTLFASESFDVITAISVIEHGFEPASVFREVSRLLKPGGFFLGSTDYWPEKIETGNVRFFGMGWTIFSRTELQGAIEGASRYNLFPVGPLELETSKATIRWLGRRYTFAWFALQKQATSEA